MSEKKKEVVKETIVREYKNHPTAISTHKPIRVKPKKKATQKSTIVKTTTTIKKASKKPSKRKKSTMSEKDLKLEKALIENFVSLQKVMVNLSVKFDDLSSKISKLLDIFEISAKALAEKDLTVEKTSRDDQKIMNIVDELSEQNKVIAKGLLLMNNKLDEDEDHGIKPIHPALLPKTPEHQKPQNSIGSNPEYQKSIFSNSPQNFKRLPGKEDAKPNF